MSAAPDPGRASTRRCEPKVTGDGDRGFPLDRRPPMIGRQVLRLAGKLVITTSDEVGRLLREHSAGDAVVAVVDLSKVTFIDCSGIDPLLRAQEGLATVDRLLVRRSPSRSARLLLHALNRLQRSARPAGGGTDIAQLDGRAARLRGALQDRQALEQAKGLLGTPLLQW